MMRRYTRDTKNRYAEGDTPDIVAAKENTHLNNYLGGVDGVELISKNSPY